MHQDFLKWPRGAADVDSEMHQPPALDPSVSLAEYAESTVRAPEPVGRTLRVLAERSFTGEAEFAIGDGVLVYFDAGHAYFAERAGDRPLGERLVSAGVVHESDLRDGMIRVGDVEHLGRLFDRVPGVERDAVIAVTERITDGVLSDIASQHATVSVVAYRHHRSGVHRWFVGPGQAAPLRPLSEVTQLDLSVVDQLPDLSASARSADALEASPPSPTDAPVAALGTPEVRIEWAEPGPIGFAAPDPAGDEQADPVVIEPTTPVEPTPPTVATESTASLAPPARPVLPPPPAPMPAPVPAAPLQPPAPPAAAPVVPDPAAAEPMELRMPTPPALPPAVEPPATEPEPPAAPELADLASPTLEAPPLRGEPETPLPLLAPEPEPDIEPAAVPEASAAPVEGASWALFDPAAMPPAAPIDEPEPAVEPPDTFRIVWPDGSQQLTGDAVRIDPPEDEPDLGAPLLPAQPEASAPVASVSVSGPSFDPGVAEPPREEVPDEVADAVRRALAAIERASSEPNTPRLRVGSVDLPDVVVPQLLDRSVVESARPAAEPIVPEPDTTVPEQAVDTVASLAPPVAAPPPAFEPPTPVASPEATPAAVAPDQQPVEQQLAEQPPVEQAFAGQPAVEQPALEQPPAEPGLPEPGQLSVVFVDKAESDEQRAGALRRLIGSLRRK